MTPRRLPCVVAVYAPPPIPWRDHDWTAWDDRRGADASPYGRGRTQDEAIADLLNELEDET